ncbi:DUF3243 family protein [Bacillus lacus]|uniref:DUF3243 family protein n=1 Tax=Metabacillus lacus TaxID=1983721 RepID=A0A7X2LZ00_9BACI|nr:DUF3243 domain-containing protein [Metabacillus lacus]MRX71164.1 DUF3243 family protein [Metabacillus lacus]
MANNEHVVNQNGEVDNSKVENVMDRMGNEKQEEILQNFDNFKSYLNEKVELGKKLGMGEEQLAKTAEKVAGYLSSNVEPKNREEKLLQELWRTGDKDQQHALAHMLVRMVEKEG